MAQVRPGPPPPLPFNVGNAVLLATNSIQVDRDCTIVSGDLVVNNASAGPTYGERDLSIDQGATVPVAYALKANSIKIDPGVVVNGTIYVNELENAGAINGDVISPISLPIIAQLPQLPPSPTAGAQDVVVGNNQTQMLGTGQYAALTVGRGATLRLGGGPYVFTSVQIDRDATLVWDGPGEVMVLGRMSLGSGATVTNGPNVATKHKMFFVYGSNGTDGLLNSTPSAVSFGRDSVFRATLLAPNGSIVAGEGLSLVGSLIGRDIHVGRGGRLELRSGFRNLPPVAHDVEGVVASGGPVTITLTGFDPDGDPLQFSIALPPSAGTLSPITPSGPTSAVVVYTPNTPGAPDAFVFRVTDPEGFTANGVVSINGGVPPPPPVNTVVVNDQTQSVPQNQPTILSLFAMAPQGVPLTVSIVPGSGPSHGTLGPLQPPPPPPGPPQPWRVPYTPQQGYAGPDSFQYQACGVINGNQVCDTGTFNLDVEGPPAEQELAPDLDVRVASGVTTTINLPRPPLNAPAAQSISGVLKVVTAATFLTNAAVAGNVADSTADGLGDNHNALPGPVPGLMSAGVGQSGGPGSNGTTRMEIEFDISGFAGLESSLTGANVLLRTNRGTIDSANTVFFFGLEANDGLLTDDDYEKLPEARPVAMMPVPQNQPVGADGQFGFDVAGPLREALQAGLSHFTIQGRVNETQQAPARGLQVYTTASGNLGMNLEPKLSLTTGGANLRTYRIVSLPSVGTLKDSNNVVITSVPYVLPSPVLLYNPGFVSLNTLTSFQYEIQEGQSSDNGTVRISIIGGDCLADPEQCNSGRD